MSEKSEFLKWTFVVGIGIVILTVIGGVTGAFGRWFDTRVEREVLVTSHQYQEARASELTTYEAQRAELTGQLLRDDLTDAQKAELEAKISGIDVLIRAAQRRR